MTRQAIAAEPTLRTRLRPEPAPPLLAPLVAGALPSACAEGLDLILEGFLAHHGVPRDLEPAGDDRHVLAGDYCYATGLVRVAASGDLFVVRALAELVAVSAGLVADGRRADLEPLWRAVVACIARPDRAAAEADLTRVVSAATAGDMAVAAAVARAVPPLPVLTEDRCDP